MLKTALLLAAAFASLATVGCKPKLNPAQIKAEQDKLKREEKRQRAAKYYDDLIKKFPDSEFVDDAKKRLQGLGPVATPGKK